MIEISKLANFILKTDHDTIKNKLPHIYDKITKANCPEILGQGAFGVVRTPMKTKKKIKIKDKEIKVPMVIKKSTGTTPIPTRMTQLGNMLIIHEMGLATEVLILGFMYKLWKRHTPHVLLLLGFGNCESPELPNTLVVDTMMIERLGLGKEMEISSPGREYVGGGLIKWDGDKIYSYFTSLQDLSLLDRTDSGNIRLPNDVDVYLPALIDELVISFLHTTHLMYAKYKIILSDLHLGNIFIQWLGKNSWFGTRRMNYTERIHYQTDQDKYLSIDTHGMIIKIGDVGISSLIPKDDLIISCKSTWDTPLTEDNFRKPTYSPTYIIFLNHFTNIFPREIINKTVIPKILNYKGNAKLVPFAWNRTKDILNSPDELEVLNSGIFDKYSNRTVVDNDTELVVRLL